MLCALPLVYDRPMEHASMLLTKPVKSARERFSLAHLREATMEAARAGLPFPLEHRYITLVHLERLLVTAARQP